MQEIKRDVPVRRHKKPSIQRPRNKTELAKDTRQVLEDNRSLAFASTAAMALIGLAFAGTVGGDIASYTTGLQEIMKEQISVYGAETLAKLGTISTIGYDIISESKFAKVTLVSYLLDKIGVNKLLDVFVDKLIPEQKKELKDLAQAIKRERDKTALANFAEKFLGILTGGYYTASNLKKTKLRDLQLIYKNLFPDDVNWKKYMDTQLRDAIIQEQSGRKRRISQLLTSAIKQTLHAATAATVYQISVDGYAYAKANMTELEKNIIDVEKQKPEKKAQTLEERRKLGELRRAQTKVKLEKLKQELKTKKQEIEVEEGLRQREKSIKEAQILKEKMKTEAHAEAAKIKEIRKIVIEKQKIEHQEALKRLAERVEKRQLKVAALTEDLARKMDVTIITKEGVSHPLPPEELLLNPELQKALDIEVTPLTEYLMKETAKASVSWIPGVGWIQSAIDKINIGLATTETVKDVAKIAEVLVRLDHGETEIDVTHWDTLNNLLKQRIPSLTKLADEIIKTSKINVKELVLRKLKDKIIEGWDNQRVVLEVGKEILGPGEDFGVDVTEMFGSDLWKKAF